MNSIKRLFFLCCLVSVSSLTIAAESQRPAKPFANPYLAASNYPVTHGRGNLSSLAGPMGTSRRLHANEIQWKPVGPINGWPQIYSGPYPNGKHVIWVGGYDRVAKLDADTLEVLTTYAIGGNTYFGDEEIERHIATIDKLDDNAFVNDNTKLWLTLFTSPLPTYRFLSRDNEFYFPHRAKDGSIWLQAYGEADAKDPASAITLRREWKFPAGIAPMMSMNTTSDGWIVIITMDGVMIALSRDFTTQYSLKLPSQHEEGPNQDWWAAFVRNGLTTDDQGGVYVVTRDNLHRVQWTGKGLSLDEADGAWSVPYPNNSGLGSGTTPGLMGWGPQEDHLAIIADGTGGNNGGNNGGNRMMAFWRDKIPDDWKGLPGFDRRVAGIAPIDFGLSATEQAQIENTPVIHGYGAFFNNTFPEHRLSQPSQTKQWMAESFSMHVPGHEARGGAMLKWDSQARVLKTAWKTQTNFVSAVCTVSGVTNLLYCWGARNRDWTLEGVDWNTGKSAFVYTLGKSHRFNPLGGPVVIAPNGSVDCGCGGGFGIVRVKPSKK